MGTLPRAATHGFDALYGLTITELEDGLVRAEVAVRKQLKQADGRVHGGVFSALSESLASLATTLAVGADGGQVMAQANQTSYLRPITSGTIHGAARPRHRGRSSWVWDVEITDDHGRLCALTRMTLAVGGAKTSAPSRSAPLGT